MFPYFAPKLLYFRVIRLLVCLRAFTPTCKFFPISIIYYYCLFVFFCFFFLCLIGLHHFFFTVFSHHHHHVVPQARISLTLSRHFSLSFMASGRPARGHERYIQGYIQGYIPYPHIQGYIQGYIPYPHIAAGCMFELVVLLLPGHMWGL